MKEVFSILFILMLNFNVTAQEQVYELRTYELEFGRPEQILHDYFKDAFIPAMNRQGIKNIGVFEEVGERLPKKYMCSFLMVISLHFKKARSYWSRTKSIWKMPVLTLK